MKKYKVITEREDGKKDKCVITMPNGFNPKLHVFGYDDTYDTMLWAKIENEIDFKGQGYNLNTIKVISNNLFSKGQFSKAKDVLFFDLYALRDYRTNKKEFEYHFNLLKQNLEDLYGGIKNEE